MKATAKTTRAKRPARATKRNEVNADGPLCRREYVEIMKPEKFVDVKL